MVCDAKWANVAGDSLKELIVVGEWMTPKIFSFQNGKITELHTNLGEMHGWWQAVATADVNTDGLQDLILGNVGENFYLAPSITNPVKLWIQDYDNNKSIEKLITYTVEGKDMPAFLKKDLEDQLPSIKKSNLRHDVYAKKSIHELFPEEVLKSATVKTFAYNSSCVAINNGNGKFTIKPLPAMCQLSCINAIYPMDVNGDRHIDLVTGGNQFGFLPQFERLDASFGDVLINNGKGEFTWKPNTTSGLDMRGEVRDIVPVRTSNGWHVLFLQNNDYPVLYRFNKQHSNH